MSDVLKISSTGGIQEIKLVPLVAEHDKRLHLVSAEWDFANPPEDAIALSRQIINTCKSYGGLGLSAVQIGKLYRVFCIGLMDTFQICFNPKVLSTSTVLHKDIEGCLSYPGLVLKVARPKTINVEFQMPNGEVRQNEFHGLTARCYLHELDHLDGTVFTDRVGDMSLMRAKAARQKFIRQVERRRKRNG